MQRLPGAGRGARPAAERDLRIDFFRGLALLVMCVNHGEQLSGKQALSYLTYAPIGITTGAEVFVFLSGLTLGLVYQPVFKARGYWMVHARCAVRAWQLYLFQMIALVSTVAVVTVLPPAFRSMPTTHLVTTSNEMLARFASLRGNPVFFDILPLYIVLLLAIPPWFPLLNASRIAGLAASIGIYAVTHACAWRFGTATLPFERMMYYNPLAWQLLFVIGLAVGIHLKSGGRTPRLTSRGVALVVVCLAIVGLWYKLARVNAVLGLFGGAAYIQGQPIPYDIPLSAKALLGPVRLAHFLLVALLVAAWCPRDAAWLRSRMAAPFVICGQHALEVFVFGVIASYATGVVMHATSGSRLLLVALGALALIASCVVAHLVRWRKSEPWRLARSRHTPEVVRVVSDS